MIENIFSSYKIFLKEIVLYGIIGIFSSTIDSIVFYYLSQRINIYESNIISINIGITLSFLLNTFLNFGVKDNLLKRAVRFISVGYSGMILSMIILFIGSNIYNFEEMSVKIFSIFIVAAFQFVLNKIITFKENI